MKELRDVHLHSRLSCSAIIHFRELRRKGIQILKCKGRKHCLILTFVCFEKARLSFSSEIGVMVLIFLCLAMC